MPDILSVEKDGQSAVFDIFIPRDLAHFSGHFPGLPILPGIVQVDWVMHLVHETFGIGNQRFAGIKGLKFTAPLVPDTRASVRLELKPESGRVLFSFHAAGKACTSGQVLFSSGEPA